jgi:hypothetical protein
MPPRAWGEVAMPISWAWLYVFFLLASSADQFVGGLSIFDGFGHPGCMSQHLNAAGLPTMGIDRRTNDPKHDGSSLSGVQYIIACLARLAPNSLVWLAPPCCSWIWISRSVHGRSSSEPLGFFNAWVDYHNELAELVACVMLAATSVGLTLSVANISRGRCQPFIMTLLSCATEFVEQAVVCASR